MADATTEMILRVQADVAAAQRQLDGLGKKVDELGAKGKKTEDGFKKGFADLIPSKAMMGLGAATLAVGVLTDAVQRAAAKQGALAEFSAITGKTGEELAKFGDIADELSVQFGTSAIDNIESFKGVLSRLGPGFASSEKAVASMGDSINTLAKASGLDATESMNALTTAMLQFGVDLADPVAAANDANYMMNVMAKAAQDGAAEIPQIAAAMEQAGVTAKNLGVSFEEVNGAIQVLAQGGKVGSEAGVALRNVMASMTKVSKLAEDELTRYGLSASELGNILTEQGLSAAMKRLGDAMKDTGSASEDAALMAALFGKENMAAAQILTENTGVMDNYNKTLGGTSTAYEQAAKVMDTTAEKAARLSAKWDVFTEKIGAVLLPILDAAVAGLTSMADALNDIASAVSDFDIGKILDKGKDAVRGFAEYSTLGLSESVLSWVGLGKAVDETTKKVGAASLRKGKKGGPTTPQEGDVSPDGKMVYKNGKWVPFSKPSTGGGKGVLAPLAGSVGALRAQLSEAQKQQTDFTVYGSERYNALGLEIEGLTRQIERMGGKFKADQIPIAAMSDEFLAALVPTQQLADELAKISDNIVLIDTVASEADFARRMAEKLEELDEGVMKFVDAGKAIGNVFSAAAFSDEGLKGAMKQTLNMLISFAEAQLLVGTAVATLQTIFGNFGGLVALAGAVALLETARGAVGSFRTGIDYVPRDQMPAFLHRGEAVLREDEAERYRQGKAPAGSGRKEGPVRVQFVAFESAIQDSNVRRSRRLA